ncbi:UNVERIFIED_CONTAM: hypothetical protein Sangu_1288200 [Sesamum angustifolium]|uniref:PWWP domain-containing protein n=1 Tax=Sesamum angustifolium TaxID=2727405 RepID=A0AAW2NKT6_9LAMI
MAGLEDIVTATKVLPENSDILTSSVSNGGASVRVNEIDVRDGLVGSSDGVLGRDEKVKDGRGSCKDNGGNGDEKFNLSGRNCSYADVNGDEKGYGNGEKLEDCDHRFCVGDFVWGKIKCHPWCPGQIYDPKDASDFAVKHSQEGRLLVAFFGDGSCSWCLPSQLVPFVENFKEMSMDSTSKSSLNAVQSAVNEIGRLLESKMTCKCVPLEKRDGLARPVAANAGVKAGVLVPEVDIHRVSIPEYEPADVLAELERLSRAVCFDSVFELAVLRSWLSAFYRAKGGYKLPIYLEPLQIEGMEDKNKNVAAVADDFSVPIEVPILRPMEDDWITSPTVNAAKSQASSDDKIYHRRKQKSVAELMGENTTVKSKSRKKATVKEEKDAGKSTSSLKRKKNNDREATEGGGHGPSSLTGKIVQLGLSMVKKVKPEEIEVDVIANTSGAKVELDEVSTPRERKKSKYLSPPYTNPSWSTIGNSSSKERETNKVTKTDRSAEHVMMASGDHCTSPPVSRSVDNASEGELPDIEIKSANNSHPTVENDTVDPLYLSKEGSLDVIWAFVSALRSSTYLHGSDYKLYEKCKTGRRRKSMASRLGNQENDLGQEKAKSSDRKTPKSAKTERKPETSKSKDAAEKSRAEKNAKKLEENASLCLSLTFRPGFPLPSKEEIVRLFGEFGSLNEKETKLVTDTRSVQIVYMKAADAEAAFRSSVRHSPFGVENVDYQLQHPSSGSMSHESHPKLSLPTDRAPHRQDISTPPTGDVMLDVRVIMRKLEIMTAILENYHSKFSPEEKSSLKDEMKSLMESVETASEKVRVMAEST